VSGVIGLFVIDPGSHTGLCWGRFWEEGEVSERIASRQFFGHETVVGEDMWQVRTIWLRWQTFRSGCVKAGIKHELVIEDFILTRLKSSDREGLSPVRIAAMLHGYRHGLADGYESAGFGPTSTLAPVYQQPSAAMTYATNARLKAWGLLVLTGDPHQRDAFRHLCLRLSDRARRRG